MNRFHGKYRGTVADNVDPLRLGRLQIVVPTVLGDSRLSWAMPCVPYAGPGVGFFAMPPKDANIWVEFEDGDPDFPIWVGCFWGDPDDRSRTTPPADKAEKKVFKTDSVTLTIDDTRGGSSVTIETTAGMKIVLNAKSVEISNGRGAMIKLQGPTTSVNGSALEVT